MIRRAFAMKLKAGCEAEYRRRHDEIWPQLTEALLAAGVLDYTIYLDRTTGTLFAAQLLEDQNSTHELAGLPIVRKWWDYMADIMEVNPDNSPVSAELVEMFHLKAEG